MANSLVLRRSILDLEAIARRRGITNLTAILPEVEGGVSAERESEGDHDEWSVGPVLGIRLPLFNQGGPARTIARLELMRGWDRLTADAVEVRAAARRAGRDVLFAHQQAKYVRDVVLPLRIATTAQAQLHYNGMYIGVFQLLDAKIREIDAARLLIQKLRDFWISESRLEQVMAGGLPGELGSARPSGLEPDLMMVSEGAEEDH